jgi:hypothetical protein
VRSSARGCDIELVRQSGVVLRGHGDRVGASQQRCLRPPVLEEPTGGFNEFNPGRRGYVTWRMFGVAPLMPSPLCKRMIGGVSSVSVSNSTRLDGTVPRPPGFPYA